MPNVKNRKLLIFGTEDFADIAFEYFTYDSDYSVEAFTVDKDYITTHEKNGKAIVPFEELEKKYPPADYDVYVAVVYGKLNKIRSEICDKVKGKGYKLASYISSRAFVWRNVVIGEHCFIFEDNTIQPFVVIGNNNILWSGNHIGHHSKIGSHCFISSHVVVSGWNKISDYTFIGVNATLANNSSIGTNCWISHGAIVSGEIPDNSIVKATTNEHKTLNEKALYRTLERASQDRHE